jgi:hypothetical protein
VTYHVHVPPVHCSVIGASWESARERFITITWFVNFRVFCVIVMGTTEEGIIRDLLNRRTDEDIAEQLKAARRRTIRVITNA